MEGYAYGRLSAALESAANHPDPDTRARAAGKASRWLQVLSGLRSGELAVGSRTPVADTPAWVTLEVLHGGFATGALLADQPLDAAERSRLRPGAPGITDRERLNLWALGDEGQTELLAALAAERYRVELPEHAALAAVALLLDRGFPEAALDLVATLRPWLHRLRFTPELLPRAEPSGTSVHLRTAGEVAEDLRAVTVPAPVATMRATLGVWNPLRDELVALWADTVDGPAPRLLGGMVIGGWPARVFPDDWAQRRQDWLDRCAQAGPPTGRHAHPRSNFARLRAALETGPDALTSRDRGRLRRALANALTKDRTAATAARAVLEQPTHAELARAVAARLDRVPAGEGVPEVDRLTADAPPAIAAKTARALDAPVAELVERGVIPSGEVLAAVLPQLTARHVAAGLADPAAAGLYARTYAAFRRRRGLLLLDLEHQVTVEELPWATALEAFRVPDEDGARAALAALTETALLALTAFPGTVLPNPLVTELNALATKAGLRLPLVEDIAADIFTGTFTPKFRAAAEVASATLAASPYGLYYDLPADWPPPVEPKPKRRRWSRRPAPVAPTRPGRRRTAEDFAARCRERADAAGAAAEGNVVARNGMVVEQAAILTTANLAVLTETLGLGPRLGGLAAPAFDRAVALVGRLPEDRHGRLLAVKNAAYAWRQALFFLGFTGRAEREAVVDRLAEATADGPLWPATLGVRHVLGDGRFDPDGRTPGGARRFLGWSVAPHWLLEGERVTGR